VSDGKRPENRLAAMQAAATKTIPLLHDCCMYATKQAMPTGD
jgi:hypothetical protein